MPRAVIPCKIRGKWLKPGLFCRLQYMKRTESGDLGAPAFEELLIKE